MAGTPAGLVRPYGDTLAAARAEDAAKAVEACTAAVKARTAGLVPQVGAWGARRRPPAATACCRPAASRCCPGVGPVDARSRIRSPS
jgi:hypothetical protein